ncbi:MAG: lysophospholipid acyltransferase family protein [Candidatus Rokuibacteriota bacterium]
MCDKHLGPLVRDKPRTAAESFERWKSHAGELARRLRGGDRPRPDTYDEEFVQTLLPLALPLYEWYFRVEVRGVENIPAEGPVILAANHSGAIPIDGAMLKVAVLREHGRNPWLLAADLAFTLPGFRDVLRMTGNARAGREETLRLLNAGEMIGVFPEGFKGIGKGWKKRYQLQRFGRGGFVEVAFESRAPIVPVAIVGAEEAYPMIARWPSLARRLGLPYIPVTPFFPLLGPLGAIPLPSKWMIEFGEPVSTIQHGPEAVEDTQLVLETGEEIRQTIQAMLNDMLARRRRALL